MAAQSPSVDRFSVKRFLFAVGVQKIVQTLNALFSESGETWALRGDPLDSDDPRRLFEPPPSKGVGPFDPSDLRWAGEEGSFVDLVSGAGSESEAQPNAPGEPGQSRPASRKAEFTGGPEPEWSPEHEGPARGDTDGADDPQPPGDSTQRPSDIVFLEQVNRVRLDREADVFAGAIADLPEQLVPFLREQLQNEFAKEAFEVSFPQTRLSPAQLSRLLAQRPSPSQEDLQCLFELFQALPALITKKEQRRVFWSLFLSPEVAALELEKRFGLFSLSQQQLAEPRPGLAPGGEEGGVEGN